MPGYGPLYEDVARRLSPVDSVGGGDFDAVGDIELDALVSAGLTARSRLLDFGCGTGRLAAWAVPFLDPGCYVGSDISPTMLRHAEALIRPMARGAALVHQPDTAFPENQSPYDMICAFSVFTHMEPEDAYRYLLSAHSVTHPGSVFVASLIPITSSLGIQIFTASAARPVESRWRDVRSFATSRDYFESIALLAGWRVREWLDGEEASIPRRGLPAEPRRVLGQSVAVMERSDPGPPTTST